MAPDDLDVPPSQVEWHRLLLGLAGRLPDDLISEARTWVAQGRLAEAAQGIAYAAATGGVPVSDAQAALLARTLRAAGEDSDALAQLDRADVELMPPFEMAPANAAVLHEHGDAIPATLDLTGGHDEVAGPDGIDVAAVAAAGREPEIIGLWRAWRFPTGQSRWPAPKRIYLATVRPGLATAVDERTGAAPVAALTDRLQAALLTAGETSPQVEVSGEGDDLPVYQRMARACAALLWTSSARPGIRLARVFDRVDAGSGPRFEPDHPRLTDQTEREQVQAYLLGGTVLLYTTALMDDVVEPANTGRVPMSFRTDGAWIWTDTVHYYLATHLLAPDADLLTHIRNQRFEVPVPDSVALHRAMAVLQAPQPEPVWTVGGADPQAAAPSGA
ncbi:hypothetical protein OHA72_37020 [Dactylosporangium sp. NBC_01737]|uniref:hypothetical protein n=1 Tax=Dactylosporangium sp. NBC_01737 TaxID=2975959 RepID=UPI002E11E5D9|nr:hypothetical protein OHA72_37020 [Dactylosporangium sp. NBC_01737]